MSEAILENVFAVIDGSFIDYVVEYKPTLLRLNDLTGSFPHLYIFTPKSSDRSFIEKYGFNVKVASLYDYQNRINNLHDYAILFGLYSKRKLLNKSVFNLNHGDYNKMLSDNRIEGRVLRDTILSFMQKAYKINPMTGISFANIQDNYFVDESELKDYFNNLVESKMILRENGLKPFKVGRKAFKGKSYRLNAEKAEEMVNVNIKTSRDHRHFKLIDIGISESDKFAFLIMPFRENEFDQLEYPNLVKKCVKKELGMECRRVDDDKKKNFIENKIYTHIAKSSIVIAELSTENPNVIYELGMAFALGKEVIITHKDFVKSDKRKLAFDYEHYDTIFYSDYKDLDTKLTDALTSLKE